MEWYKDGMYPEWHLSGENFSPKKLLELYPKLIITSNHEKDDVGQRGRFKGKKYGYGSCTIVVDNSIVCKLDWLLNFILGNAEEIRNLGVEDEIIWIVWWGIQGNMELDKNLLKKISETGLNMAMNYYYINGKWELFYE